MWGCPRRAFSALCALILLMVVAMWGVGAESNMEGVKDSGWRRITTKVASTRVLLQTGEARAQQAEELASIESELELLIDSGVDVNAKVGRGGNTPLVLAAFAGLDEIVARLIDLGADVNGTIESGYSPLLVAARGNHQKVGEMLIEAEADVKQESNTGLSAIWWAAFRGNAKLVKLLLDAGADPSAASRSGASALLMATQEGRVETVRLLVEAGADVDAPSKKGSSPLLIAVQYNERNEENHVQICRMLLEGGANPDRLKPGSQQTMLWIAAYMADPETTALLVKAGADVDREADDGSTPLYVATIKNCVGCLEELLEGGADVDPTYSSTNWTPLHVAAALGHKRATQALLENGANKNLRDSKKRRPIDVIGLERRDLSPKKREEIRILLDDGLKVKIEEAGDVTQPSKNADRGESALSVPEHDEEVKDNKTDENEKKSELSGDKEPKPPAENAEAEKKLEAEVEEKQWTEKTKQETSKPKKKSEREDPGKKTSSTEKKAKAETEPVAPEEEKPAPETTLEEENQAENPASGEFEESSSTLEEENQAEKLASGTFEESSSTLEEENQAEKPASGTVEESSSEIQIISASPVVGESEGVTESIVSAPIVVGFSANSKPEGTTRGAGFPWWALWMIVASVVFVCCCCVVIVVCRKRTQESQNRELVYGLSEPVPSSRISGTTTEQDLEGEEGAPESSATEGGGHSNPVFGRELSANDVGKEEEV